MDNDTNTLNIELIRQAQAGCRESQALLTELTEQKVFPYLYRLTFDFHLTQDLCQETLLEVIQALPRLELKQASSYWAWVFKAAQNRVHKHYRKSGNQRLRITGVENMRHFAQKIIDESALPVDELSQSELLRAVLKAMHSMKLNYRSVLILRCLQGLSYADIAEILGRSQLAARLLFYKAKAALKHKLAREGYDQNYLLPSLTLLAGITAVNGTGKTLAAVPVTASTLQLPALVASLGWLFTTLSGLAMLVLSTAGLYLGVTLIPKPTPREHLAKQVTQGSFACPSAVFDTNDPGQHGFYQANEMAFYEGQPTLAIADMAALLHVDDANAIRLKKKQIITRSLTVPVRISTSMSVAVETFSSILNKTTKQP